jgi:hypothetical protein
MERYQPGRTFVTASEVSALLNISRSTIYSWCLFGKVDGINPTGKCLRIFSRSLEEFLESRMYRKNLAAPRRSLVLIRDARSGPREGSISQEVL